MHRQFSLLFLFLTTTLATPRNLVILPSANLESIAAINIGVACCPWEIQEFGECTPVCNEGYRFQPASSSVAYDECVLITPKTTVGQYLYTCPNDLTLCPYPSTSFNGCFDLFNDPSSCGTCLHDCNTIPGAKTMTCVNGACKPEGCFPGYTMWVDGMTCIKDL